MATNINSRNKLIKINGEYVKLYVTTNNTLPKLLKNTGSLIVYHQDKDDVQTNYLYLGNELISSGWGFDNENDKEYAKTVLKQWDKLFTFSTGVKPKSTSAPEYVDKFWDNLNENDPLYAYKNDFVDNIINSSENNFSIPYLLNNIIKSTKVEFNEALKNYIPIKSDISKEEISPYIYQRLSSNVSNPNQKIDMKYLGYMFGPAIYTKPEITNFDIKLYYSYYDRKHQLFVNETEAKYVNGKYRVPKGAFISTIEVTVNTVLNDSPRLVSVTFDYAHTKYNRELTIDLPEYNAITELIPDSLTNVSNNSIFRNQVMNEFIKTDSTIFTYDYSSCTLNVSNMVETNIGMQTKVTFRPTSKDQYILVTDDFQIMKNVSVNYKGAETPKKYAAFNSSWFSSVTNDEFTGYDSYEYMFEDGSIHMNLDIDIECVEVGRIFSSIHSLIMSDYNIDTKKIFDYIGDNTSNSVSPIIDNNIKFNVEESIRDNISNIFVTTFAVPYNKTIKKMYMDILETNTNNVSRNDVTGLLKCVHNIRVFGSCSPTSFDKNSSQYLLSFPIDRTNVFSQPFKLYVLLIDTAVFNNKYTVKSFDVNLEDVGDDLENTNIINFTEKPVSYDSRYVYNFTTMRTIINRIIVGLNDLRLSLVKLYKNGYLSLITDEEFDSAHIYNLNTDPRYGNRNMFLRMMIQQNSIFNTDGTLHGGAKNFLEKINRAF